jgi:hypothetical protein
VMAMAKTASLKNRIRSYSTSEVNGIKRLE